MQEKPIIKGFTPLLPLLGVGAVPLGAALLALGGPVDDTTQKLLMMSDLLLGSLIFLLSLWWSRSAGGDVRELWSRINAVLFLTVLTQAVHYGSVVGFFHTMLIRDVFRLVNLGLIVSVVVSIRHLTTQAPRHQPAAAPAGPAGVEQQTNHTSAATSWLVYIAAAFIGVVIASLIESRVPANAISGLAQAIKVFTLAVTVMVLMLNFSFAQKTGGRVRRVWLWFGISITVSFIVQVLEMALGPSRQQVEILRTAFRLALDLTALLTVFSIRQLGSIRP